MFREKQKQEMKLLKQELDMMPRGDNKKENVRKLREAKEIELQEKVSAVPEALHVYILVMAQPFSLS